MARVAAAGPDDVDAAVEAARAAFDAGPWPRLEPAERIDAVRRLAKAYGERRSEMAELITSEIGAPISFAQRAQVGAAVDDDECVLRSGRGVSVA